jgi:hypothetical protein
VKELRRLGVCGRSAISADGQWAIHSPPSTGQFLSVDPLVGETGQPYTYAGDDPVNESDPTGLSGNPVDVYCSGGGPGDPAQQSRECAGAQQIAKQVTSEECKNDPGACLSSQQYYSLCGTAFIFEVCLTAGGGHTYLDLGVGIGTPAPTVSGTIGDIHGGPSQQLLGGWSYHAGGQYWAGGGWAQTLSCPSGEGARGAYATLGTPGAGAYYSYGIKLW